MVCCMSLASFFKFLFIYFGYPSFIWVSTDVHGLPLTAAVGATLVAVLGLAIAVASSVAEAWPVGCADFSSCSMQAVV